MNITAPIIFACSMAVLLVVLFLTWIYKDRKW